MKTKDILAIAIIYITIVFIFWIITIQYSHSKEVYKLQSELLEAKNAVIYFDNRMNVLEDNIHYLNIYIYEKETELQEYKYLEKLKKDIDRSN